MLHLRRRNGSGGLDGDFVLGVDEELIYKRIYQPKGCRDCWITDPPFAVSE